jgi:transcriptional regulator with XRE-family HTH domain
MNDSSDREVAIRFASNLVMCRKRAGYSQEELGFLASLHRTEISMLERGSRIPRIDTMIKLASALEASPEDLLAGLEWHPGEYRRGRVLVLLHAAGRDGRAMNAAECFAANLVRARQRAGLSGRGFDRASIHPTEISEGGDSSTPRPMQRRRCWPRLRAWRRWGEGSACRLD